jgi:hypothetical protein
MTQGQVVDTFTAQEFMQETLQKISQTELDAIAGELREKSQRLQAVLAPDAIAELDEDALFRILRSVFATRRRAQTILDAVGPGGLRRLMRGLLYGDQPLATRFQTFCEVLSGDENMVPTNVSYDLAGELLHFVFPDDYWLWTRWMWDPRTETGALPLVTMEDYDLHAPSLGQAYLKVGEAVAFVQATGEAAGFTSLSHGPFGIDVFLTCVYVIYVYTALRLRMTQEFNRVVPQLPEFTRRLLGVHRMEIQTSEVS